MLYILRPILRNILIKFVNNSESLQEYNREKILETISKRSKEGNLFIHVADGLKGLWIIFFGMDLQNDPNLSSIYGGHIIQTDPKGPIRSNN